MPGSVAGISGEEHKTMRDKVVGVDSVIGFNCGMNIIGEVLCWVAESECSIIWCSLARATLLVAGVVLWWGKEVLPERQ